MIIKPKVRGNGAKLADYLLKSGKNEKTELVEMRGFHAPTLKGSLGLVEVMAEATQCEQPFYHVGFRLAPGETLRPEQWKECADRLEKKLGLENQPRALVMHTHKGETHMHAVWSRIDEQSMKAINMFQDWPRCQQVARELEREFGLKRVRDRNDERKHKAPTFNEDQQARRKGQNLEEKRGAIRAAWESSDNRQSFAAALDEAGFVFAKGDRRDFVAVDELGSVYTIGKRTTGANAAEVRAKLHGIGGDLMPTIEEAREIQRDRAQGRATEYDHEKWENALAKAAIEKAAREEREAKEQRVAEGKKPRVLDDSVTAFKERQAKDRASRDAAKLETMQRAPEEAAQKREIQQISRNTEKGVKVVCDATGKVFDRVADYLDGALDFLVGAPTPRKITPEEYIKSADAKREHIAQQRVQREKNAALDRMAESIRQKKAISGAELRSLTQNDLDNIRSLGDARLLDLIRQREEELKKQRQRFRER